MTSLAYDRILDALRDLGSKVTGNGGSAKAQCPAREDRSPSLSVLSIEGQAQLYCHAGCETSQVLDDLGLSMRDLFDEPRGARYGYDDGRFVHRSPSKKFWQTGNTAGHAVLYRLDRLAEAVDDERDIYVVEGEKDVHAIEAIGGIATCSPMGAGKWSKVDPSPLFGGKVTIVADKDEPGYRHARDILQSLNGMCPSIRTVVAREGKDAADHIAAGHSLAEFEVIDLAADDAADDNEDEGRPIPLDHVGVLPPFPTDALPDPMGAMATAVAHFTQTDPALAGTVALGVLSACAAGRATVEVRGTWTEPLNLYAVVSSAPGTRKSPVFATMTAPLIEAEKSMFEQWRPAVLEAETQQRIAGEAARRAERAAASGDNDKEKMAEAISAAMFAESIDVPTQPRILADDVTPEALTSLLAAHGGRIALMSAEGGIFDTLAGRYSNGVPNLDTFLKGWSAEPVRVDRRGGPSEYVPNAHVTIMLTIQPTVLTTIARNGAFRGRGLLARFLFALPPNNVGRRKVGTAPVDPELTATYDDAIRTFAVDMEQWAGDPARLVIAPAAGELLLEFERMIEPRLASTGDLGVIADWGSKAAGQLIRIAALLHLANGKEALFQPITAATMTDALRLLDYFTEHAKAAFIAMGTDGPTADAIYILDHLKREDAADFTVRDLHVRIGTSRFPRVDDLKDALDVLEDHRWITRQVEPERRGPGRKPSPRYKVTQLTESTD